MFIKQNKNSNEDLSGSVYAVILFGNLGSYFSLHIWRHILLNLGKLVLKYLKLGKYRPCLDRERLPYKAVKMALYHWSEAEKNRLNLQVFHSVLL